MRQATLANIIDVANGNDKATTKAAKMRAKNLVNAAKSLDLLRQNLQNSINKDIDNVIKKYLTVSGCILIVSIDIGMSICHCFHESNFSDILWLGY